jgi:hypothetical protein
MTIDSVCRRFESKLRLRPNPPTVDPKPVQSVASNDQVAAEKSDRIGKSDDVDMITDDLENCLLDERNLNFLCSEDKDDEEMDNATEQGTSDKDEGIEGDDEMDESPERYMTDEETDDGEEKVDILVTEDCSQILAPDTMTFITLPNNPAEKKKALLDVFIFYSRYAFLYHGYLINLDNIPIPEGLWRSSFTSNETSHIVKKQEEQLMGDILSRMWSIVAQWQTRLDYPAVPTTRMEIELAKTQEARTRRTAYFESIVRKQGPETILMLFQDFKSWSELGGHFEKLLHDEDRFYDDLEGLVAQLAILAEAHFVHRVIARAEFEIAGAESIESLIKCLIQTCATQPLSICSDEARLLRSTGITLRFRVPKDSMN